MRSYPVPANEDQRLQVLHSLGIDFSAPIEEIQRLTELASQIAKTPIALVSLVDDDVQNFAANVGLDGVAGTSRDVAFCAHAIMERNQLVVPDAQDDPRFRDNPLVTGSVGIRAYAGSVLEPEPGALVGTLCVIDTVPRQFTDDIMRQLDHLSFCISALLRAHRDRLHLRDRLAHEARQQVALRELASRDPMTGLLNQAGFRQMVDERLKKSHGNEFLAVIDIDHFKQVNDRWGHPFGDRYLKLIADGLVSGLGSDAIVGRIGGDEFAALLPLNDQAGPIEAVNDARKAIQTLLTETGKVNLGKLSVGLSSVTNASERNFESLYQRADVALYASKDRGRNTTSVFSNELNSRYNLRVLRTRFGDALEAGKVEAFFQPKIDLREEKISGFELLSRWRDSRRGLLLPADFEPLLTDQVIAPELTRHMLGAAVRAQHELQQRGIKTLRMAVNVTHFDLSNPSFFEETHIRLSEGGLEWSSLELEVTENAILSDADHVIKKSLTTIREHGGLIALDDFGTGHASLLHLRDWPIDILKLDKEFVRKIAEDERDEAIVRSIIDLAGQLGLRVTAEGIETRQVANKLMDMGCLEGQGYLYSPGVEWPEALQLICRCGEFTCDLEVAHNGRPHSQTGGLRTSPSRRVNLSPS